VGKLCGWGAAKHDFPANPADKTEGTANQSALAAGGVIRTMVDMGVESPSASAAAGAAVGMGVMAVGTANRLCQTVAAATRQTFLATAVTTALNRKT